MPMFHPDLRLARFIPNISFGPRMASMVRKLTRGLKAPAPKANVSREFRQQQVAALRGPLFGRP
jgi:hypothetical protein